MTMLTKQSQRLQRLVKLLNPGEPKTKAALIQALGNEGSLRTIQRDLEALQNLGAPLRYCGRLGVEFTREWFLPMLAELGSDETLAGLTAHQLFADNLPPGFHQDFDTISKIHRAAGRMSSEDESFLSNLSRHGTCKVKVLDSDAYDQVVEAARHRCQLSAMYLNGRGERSPRLLEIHALFFHVDAWYAHAMELPSGAWKDFALHRFTEAKLLRHHRFERDADAVAAVRDGKIFNQDLWTGIRLRLSPDWQMHIRERHWFPGQSFTPDAEGIWEMTIPSAPSYPLMRFVFSFMGEIEVLAPTELKIAVRRVAAAI
ncbi:MAG: hypothetical protein RL095_853 [Verrucomicrobiota bacterium]|jgi:predicted DNA-binding transcriptional regulator YafY